MRRLRRRLFAFEVPTENGYAGGESMICGRCGKEFRQYPLARASWYCDDCRNVLFKPKKKVMTNADRIRAMTDEELAELFYAIADKRESCLKICNNLDWCRRNNAPEPICQNHYLDWLRQPAKEV